MLQLRLKAWKTREKGEREREWYHHRFLVCINKYKTLHGHNNALKKLNFNACLSLSSYHLYRERAINSWMVGSWHITREETQMLKDDITVLPQYTRDKQIVCMWGGTVATLHFREKSQKLQLNH